MIRQAQVNSLCSHLKKHHGVYCSVVKANSQSTGNGQILTPVAPKPLNGFRWSLEYITTNPRGAATCVVSANTWLVICFGFLVYHFFFLYFIILIAPSPYMVYVDRFWRSIRQGSVFCGSQRECYPFKRSNPKPSFWRREYAFSKLTRKMLKTSILSNTASIPSKFKKW